MAKRKKKAPYAKPELSFEPEWHEPAYTLPAETIQTLLNRLNDLADQCPAVAQLLHHEHLCSDVTLRTPQDVKLGQDPQVNHVKTTPQWVTRMVAMLNLADVLSMCLTGRCNSVEQVNVDGKLRFRLHHPV